MIVAIAYSHNTLSFRIDLVPMGLLEIVMLRREAGRRPLTKGTAALSSIALATATHRSVVCQE